MILDKLDLSIPEGSSTVIIGGSGTGKSVLIKCILGLLEPDEGEIIYKDVNLTKKTREDVKFYNKIGMLFQGSALFDSLQVWENITFGFNKTENMSIDKAKNLAIEKLNKVGLDSSVIELYPSELSGGMQKRVALARAIARDPELLFFDEPTTGLDPIMADVINNLINEVTADVGATAITITHDMDSAKKISDNMSMLYQGKVIWNGPTSNIENTNNEYVEQFIKGSSEVPIKINVND